MRLFLFFIFLFSTISCDGKLTQFDCERITDEESCIDRGCVYEGGRVLTVDCGESCVFTPETEGYYGCFLSDTHIGEQISTFYHRSVGEEFQIIRLGSNIGNLTGWERGTPDCVTCTWDY